MKNITDSLFSRTDNEANGKILTLLLCFQIDLRTESRSYKELYHHKHWNVYNLVNINVAIIIWSKIQRYRGQIK